MFLLLAAVCLFLTGPVMAEWTTPQPVTEVNTEREELTPFLSFDGKSLYFSRRATDGRYYMYEATRPQPFGPFTSESQISNLGHAVYSPWVSQDNLRMYYHWEGSRWLLKISQRTSVNDPWPQGTNIDEINQYGKVHCPALTADELTIVFGSPDFSGGAGGYDIWMATRPDMNSPFGNLRNLTEINTSSNDLVPYISPDGLELYFYSNRNGGYPQIFKATRPSVNGPFGNIEHLSVFDSPGGGSYDPALSSDGSAFYFVRKLDGGTPSTFDIYVSYQPVAEVTNLIATAIEKKFKALDALDAALTAEDTAYDALEELLESGDYGDMKKGDVVKAKQRIHSAIQHEEQAQMDIDKSIEKLNDGLEALGIEP